MFFILASKPFICLPPGYKVKRHIVRRVTKILDFCKHMQISPLLSSYSKQQREHVPGCLGNTWKIPVFPSYLLKDDGCTEMCGRKMKCSNPALNPPFSTKRMAAGN
ncbi:hypothetical protein CDAR_20661 [Caerostris darwini]|uniref:Uncharacterized protein n=1 Tax=Caerostris darwini TaxID=1538125 RepID=A0AAV4QEU0_9ARAC|nr:hypothetical protein CDAR_20661 [Caerostris darwini]